MFPGSSGLSSEIVDSVFLFFLALCVALLVLITVLMVVFVVRYRRSRHPVAEQVKENPLLEILWTAVPTVLVLCMFYWGWMGVAGWQLSGWRNVDDTRSILFVAGGCLLVAAALGYQWYIMRHVLNRSITQPQRAEIQAE